MSTNREISLCKNYLHLLFINLRLSFAASEKKLSALSTVIVVVRVGDLVDVGRHRPPINAASMPLQHRVDAVLVGSEPVYDGAALK